MKLGELIEDRKIRLEQKLGVRLSYEDLAERARTQGHFISRATIHSFATESKPLRQTPKRPTIAALAVALDTTERDVVLAAVESMGISITEADNLDDWSRSVPWLTLTGARSNEQVRQIFQAAQLVADAQDAEPSSPSRPQREDAG